jgi:hypothetical protein
MAGLASKPDSILLKNRCGRGLEYNPSRDRQAAVRRERRFRPSAKIGLLAFG